MSTDTGKVLAFLILAGFTVAAFVFIYKMVPETKGKPITENVNTIQGRKMELE